MARIAIDYDGTFTADPLLWADFIAAAQRNGHEVICVTMRRPDEAIEMPCPILYTSRRAKIPATRDEVGPVDIWIDDAPHWLFSDG